MLRTHGIIVDTSLGEVEGEFWSDGLLAIATSAKDAERHDVRAPADVALAFDDLGLPHEEATLVAEHLWSGELGSFARRFVNPS